MTHDFAYMRIQAEHDDKAMREIHPDWAAMRLSHPVYGHGRVQSYREGGQRRSSSTMQRLVPSSGPSPSPFTAGGSPACRIFGYINFPCCHITIMSRIMST